MSSGFFDYPGQPPREGAARSAFAGLHEEDWNALLQYASRRRYEAGALIFQPGEDEPSVFFVISGAVRLSRPRPASFTGQSLTFGEGEVFGILTFLDQAPRGMTARAETEVEVLMLSRVMFDRLASWQPRIALTLLHDFAGNVARRLRGHETLL
jgi:CRP/FNR family transcriptional regulator